MKFGASLLSCLELSPLPNNDSTEVNGGLEGGKSLILYQPYAIYTTYRNYEKTHLDRFMWLMKCPRLCWPRLVSYPRTTYRKHWSRYRMNLVNKHYRTLHATAQSHRQQRSFYGYPPESTRSARGTSLSTCQTLICCEITRRFSVHRSRSYPQRSTNTELESSTGTLQLHTSVTTVYWVSFGTDFEVRRRRVFPYRSLHSFKFQLCLKRLVRIWSCVWSKGLWARFV